MKHPSPTIRRAASLISRLPIAFAVRYLDCSTGYALATPTLLKQYQLLPKHEQRMGDRQPLHIHPPGWISAFD